MPASQANAPLPPASSQTSLLSLPDELIEHVVSFLDTPCYSKATRDEHSSLASACRRLRAVVVPLQCKAFTIDSECSRFGRFVNALRRRGALVQTLAVSISPGRPPRTVEDCIEAVSTWLVHCTGLVKFKLTLSGDRITDAQDELFARLCRELGRIGKTLVSLDVNTYAIASNDVIARGMHGVFKSTPNLRQFRHRLRNGLSALRLNNLPQLEVLDIYNPLYAMEVTRTMPALRSFKISDLDYAGLQVLSHCFGTSLVSLELSHFTAPRTSTHTPPLLFRSLKSVISAPSSDHLVLALFTYIDPSTPITNIGVQELGSIAGELTAFLLSGSCRTLRCVVVNEPDSDRQVIHFPTDSSEAGRRFCLRPYYEGTYHIRLRQFRELAASKGIEVVAPWYREDLGSSEIPKDFKG